MMEVFGMSKFMKKLILLALFITATFLTANAQYTKLCDFTDAANGSYPGGSLFSDGTFLYGMTREGGNGMGVIFKIKPDGTGYSKLLDFAGAANGSYPEGGALISDGTFLYGMTIGGGTNGMGVIFKIKPDGTSYSKLLDFAGLANGRYPEGSLISDGTFLYGMTSEGGTNGLGVIFKIMPDGTGYSKLLDFAGAANGRLPNGSLISDGIFLYGMTLYGGTNDIGVIFKIKPDGTGYFKILDFAGAANGKEPYGSLISDGTFLYGMTSWGGANDMGVIFKIMPDGTGYSKILDFAGTANGSYPEGSLISDGTFLYGMTAYGGINDMGVIFKIKSDGTGYSRLLNFAGAANGRQPWGSLISDGTFLYGMTFYGGTYDVGTVFKYQYYVNGIAENNAGAGFNVYPNPGSGKFLISSNRDISSIEIYNSMGKKVFQSKNPHKEIDISNQTKGIYFIKIYNGQTVLAKKIVIQ